MNKYLEELRDNPYVREKDLGNGIHSFNYSNKAFYEHHWDNVTERARGLFVDVNTEKVVARSFDKFFAINERPETRLDVLKETLVFPIKIFRKENGFLGICSYDENSDNNIFLASKSTNQGQFAKYFSDIFYSYFKNKNEIITFAEYLKEENVSAVFEVIDPQNDPHIVKYDESKMILLEIIENDYVYKPKGYEEVEYVGDNWNIPVKYIRDMLWTYNEFIDFLEDISNEKEIEGYVLEDSNGFMLKIKTDWYKYWKRVRACAQYLFKMATKENTNIISMSIFSEAMKKYRFNKSDRQLLVFILSYIETMTQFNRECDAVRISIPNIRDQYLEYYLPEVER